MLNQSNEYSSEELYPELTDKDKIKSLINILRGHEEFVLDSSGVIISSNLETVAISGYEEWEVIGKSISLFYSQEDKAKYKYEHDLYKTFKEQRISTTELKVKKHGDKFLATTHFEALYNSEGGLNGFRITLRDATQRSEIGVGAKRIKEENSNLYKNPFVGIFKAYITDLSFVRLNAKAIEIFGVDSNCDKLSDIFNFPNQFTIFKESLFRDGFVDNFMMQVANEKVEIYCVISCTLDRNEGFIEGVIKDITESRKQAIEIQKVKAELDNFLYRTSHDIRAPLATILGLTNLIKYDKSTSMQQVLNYAQLIEDRVLQLDFVLKELSDVSYNNLHDLRIEKINCEILLKRIIQPLREKFPFININVSINSDSPIFYSDLSRVKVILGNVIHNAFLYHNTAIVNSQVDVVFRRMDSKIVFEIEDNGIGIEEAHLAKVYDMFFRIQADRHGSGLGLFVAKSMLDKLGGQIEIKSQIGIGTLVSIVLSNEPSSTRTLK